MIPLLIYFSSLQWAEYILFAALLIAVSIIFGIMARYYTYVDPKLVEAEYEEKELARKEEEESNANQSTAQSEF